MYQPHIDQFTLGHIKAALLRSQEEGLLSAKTDQQVSYAMKLIALAEAKAMPSASEMIQLDSFARDCARYGSD